MKIRFLAPASWELKEAVRYFNQKRNGLGDEFRDEAWATLCRIRAFPVAWHPLAGSIRRCSMRRFPYGIIYEPTAAEIIVIAVAHFRRKPEYWQGRA